MSEECGASRDGRSDGASGTGAPVRPTLTEPDMDAAIDTVAREMTNLEPPAAFRELVMDRIRLQPPPRVSGWWLPTTPRSAWTAAAVVLVMMAATGVWIKRSDIVPVAGDMASMTVTQPWALDRPAVPARSSGGRSAEARRVIALPEQVSRIRSGSTRVMAASPVRTAADDVEMLPALAELEPMQFTNLVPAAIHVPMVEVAPLVDIPSLDIPSLHAEPTDARSTDPKKEN
jgi:hypothetical protein